MRPFASTTPGQVVLLNGASSSGKSTLAQQLLTDLPRPFFHLGVDLIGAARSEPRTAELSPTDLDEVLRSTRAGFHRAVAGMAWAGNDIVMDHVLSEPWRLDDCLDVFTGVDVVFVGVQCAVGELVRREHRRGDRRTGTAISALSVVHAHDDYDLEIHTERHRPAECATRIRHFLAAPQGERAFDRLRRQRHLR